MNFPYIIFVVNYYTGYSYRMVLQYNTAIPSSAAVERMFSVGKDVLKRKRARLSDVHFEMLVFLKALKL